MSDERTWISGAYGQRLDDNRDQGGHINPHQLASPERLAQARQLFPEAKLEDFDVVQSGVDKWLFIDKATGNQFKRVHHHVLQDLATAHMQNISCFVVDAAGRMHFLRRRGEEQTPTSVVHVGTVSGRQVGS